MKDQWFIEKMQALNTFVTNFQGKPIKITGFVYREDGIPESQFIVGRLAMTHCIADIALWHYCGIASSKPICERQLDYGNGYYRSNDIPWTESDEDHG